MQADRFTIKSQEALGRRRRAWPRQRRNPQVTPMHLLAALLESERRRRARASRGSRRGRAARARQARRADAALCGPRSTGRSADAAALLGGLYATVARRPHRELTSGAARGRAARPARCGDQYVSTEHLLLALAAEEGPRRRRALRAVGASRERLLQALVEVRGPHRVTDQSPEDKYQALERYGRDLTEAAEQGKLDPVIGRDEEIRRVIQVLSRRTKNNPVLIGEPGRRQDGDRRGPRPADRLRRRARVAARTARDRPGHRLADRRRQVPRRVRGPPEGGARRRSPRPRAT